MGFLFRTYNMGFTDSVARTKCMVFRHPMARTHALIFIGILAHSLALVFKDIVARTLDVVFSQAMARTVLMNLNYLLARIQQIVFRPPMAPTQTCSFIFSFLFFFRPSIHLSYSFCLSSLIFSWMGFKNSNIFFLSLRSMP